MEVFAGLVVEEMLGLTAVAGIIVNGTVVLTLFLNDLGANDGECQLLLLFGTIGDEVAAGAMSRGCVPNEWVAWTGLHRRATYQEL